MIVHDVKQGSADWFAVRLGIPTASEFHRILTPTGKQSAQARPYAFRLATERLLNRPLESIDHLEWVERGKILEPEAARAYEIITGETTRPVGFITSDDGRMGCSPDRLVVGAQGGLEIKCPAPQTHLAYLIDGLGPDYRPQVQGQMLVADLEYVDFFSYHPEMPPARIRTFRDPDYIAALRASLLDFCKLLDWIIESAKKAGAILPAKRVLAPVAQAYDPSADIPAWVGLPE